MKPEIRQIPFKANKADGKDDYDAIRLIIGDEFYIDVGCRIGEGSKQKAQVIANEVQAALNQLISIKEAKNEK